MKIAIINSGVLPLPPVKGGAVESLIGHFIEENEIHKDFEIFAYSIANKEAINKSKSFKFTDFIFIDNSRVIYRFERVLRYIARKYLKMKICNKYINMVMKDLIKRQIDLVIIENNPEFIFEIKKKINVKVLQHIHNDYLEQENNTNKQIMDNSDKVLFVSDCIRDNVNWYPNKNKFYTLLNGIDIERFSSKKWNQEANEFREKHSIEQDDVVLLYSGRLADQKGVLELIKAFIKINSDNVKLLVVGSSWYSSQSKNPYIESLVETSKLVKDKVIFTGYIKYENMPIVYAASDIVVIPSLGVEAAGLVALEARAAGKAVVISNSGGLPQYADGTCIIIDKNDEHFVENLSEEIKKLIVKDDFRKEKAQLSSNKIQKFGKREYYNEFKRIIIETMDQNKIINSNLTK